MHIKVAGFWLRIASSYLTLFLLLLNTAVLVSVVYFTKLLSFGFFDYRFLLLCFSVFIFLLFIDSCIQGLSGANLAKSILGIRLVDFNQDTTIGVLRSLLRTIVSFISLLLFGLGFLSMAFNLEKRSLHDTLVSSRVVEMPKAFFGKIFTGIIVVFVNLLGLSSSLACLFLLIAAPVTFLKSANDMSKITSFESQIFNKDAGARIKIPVSNGKIFALNKLANYDFIDFDLDKTSKFNYIEQAKLETLGAKPTDFSIRVLDWQEDITKAKFELAVVIPKMIFKDSSDKDLIIKNQKFIISDGATVIGQDFLNLFNYRILDNLNQLELKLFDDEAKLMSDAALNAEEKSFLLSIMKVIRVKWLEFLAKLEPEELESFETLNDASKERLANNIDVDIDFNTGYLSSIKLNEANSNKAFNRLCKKFFEESIPKFSQAPETLKDKSKAIEINLKYQASL